MMFLANSSRRIAACCGLLASIALAPIAWAQTPAPVDTGDVDIFVHSGSLHPDADGHMNPTFDVPVPGATVTVTPIGGSTNGTSATTDADGNAKLKGLKPGIYKVKVVAKGKTLVYHIKVDRGQTTQQGVENWGPPTEDSTPDTATIDRLVKAANDAAQACDKAAYNKAVEALEDLAGNLDLDLSRLKDLIDEAQKTNGGLPDDMSELTDRLTKLRAILANPHSGDDLAKSGAPADPQNGIPTLLEFMRLVAERDREKAQLEAVEAGRKKIKPLPASCTPSTTTPPDKPTTDKPPTDKPTDKPADKPVVPPQSDKPKPKPGD